MALQKELVRVTLPCLILVTVCTASSDPCLPLVCNRTGWLECLHDTVTVHFQYDSGTCILCDGQEESMITVDTSHADRTISCLSDSTLAIRRYPFGVLSTEKLKPFAHSPVHTLVLLDDEITDVEEGTLNSHLQKLSLDFNRLTHVKQRWFTGVDKLSYLGLSNNKIAKIDPGCFRNISMLLELNLENNSLQVVDSDWFLGLPMLMFLYLGGNDIASLSPSAFEDMLVHELNLQKNPLSCLDWGLSRVSQFESNLRVGGDRLMTVYDTMPHRMVWSLSIHKHTPDTQIITVEVPFFYLCVASGLLNDSLVWNFDSVQSVPRHESKDSFPDLCISSHESSQRIVRLHRFVVIATDAPPDELDLHYPDKCRQVWEHNAGITVAFDNNSVVQVVSMGVGNSTSTMTDVAILFDITKDTRTVGTHTSTDHTKNIPCTVLSKRNLSQHLTFNISSAPKEPRKVCPALTGDTDDVSFLTSVPHTSSASLGDQKSPTPTAIQATMSLVSTLQAGTLPTIVDDTHTESRPILVPVVVSMVGILSLVLFVAFLLKVRHNAFQNNLPNGQGRRQPGLVSCTAMPSDLRAIQSTDDLPHTYWEIPDNLAAAQRPLPAVPHTCSLPHLYTEIPDHIAAAQRPLPAFPHTPQEYQNAASCWSLPALLPSDDTECETIRFYSAAAEPLLPTITKTGHNQRLYQGNDAATVPSLRSTNERGTAAYQVPKEVRHRDCIVLYKTQSEVSGDGTCNTPRRASLPLPLATLPNTYWPWKIPENTARRVSLPLATLPNTYWPWHIPENGSRNTPRRESLQLATLPNTYWPWKIPEKGTHNTPRRESLPLVTLPNTYWPWHIPENGSRNTPRRASLPLATLPNTYWPWEIPGREGNP
uniref:LRRCT domain-containing protein n=1 Tax=Branchiostoma floridae TaxID=7739 RepID=C3ZEX2_BRAFL|eukprot:XP_002593267.1 hypothetical protein BRAFLDRAFT_83812 [Branchiostoma floridae]